MILESSRNCFFTNFRKKSVRTGARGTAGELYVIVSPMLAAEAALQCERYFDAILYLEIYLQRIRVDSSHDQGGVRRSCNATVLEEWHLDDNALRLLAEALSKISEVCCSPD